MSTHTICFPGEVRNISILPKLKKKQHLNESYVNTCPAEPGYTLLL